MREQEGNYALGMQLGRYVSKQVLLASVLSIVLGLACVITAKSALAVTGAVPGIREFDLVKDVQDKLSPEQEARLEQQIKAFTAKFGTGMAVYIDNSLKGMDYEAFGDSLGAAWKLGDGHDDKWVVIAVFTSDRKVRISCSQNLDSKLTQSASLNIINLDITPDFKNNNYRAGIEKGINSIDLILSPKAGSIGQIFKKWRRIINTNTLLVALVAVFVLFNFALAVNRNRSGYGGYYNGYGYT